MLLETVSAKGEIMLYQIETKKSISEIEKSLGTISARHKFGLLTIHNLKEKMNEKGVPFKKDCLIFEVCNPQQAQKILDGNMDISNLLPCRIAAYEKNGKVVLSTVKPTVLLAMFPNPELKKIAEEVERVLISIIDEAGRGAENP